MCAQCKNKSAVTRQEAEEVVRDIRQLDFEKAVEVFLESVNGHPEKPDPSPLTPSGSIPPYLKPNKKKKRRKKPGQKKGHPGKSRQVPEHIDKQAEHQLDNCPHCQTPLKKPIKTRKRYIEDLPQVQPVVTEHIVNGYWCPCCRKIVEPAVVEAMPNDNIGLHTVVMSAWLHYLGGVSINYIVDLLNKLFRFNITPGGLTQGWLKLAAYLKAEYQRIGEEARNSAYLHADETGWRQSGDLRWLWCFTNKKLCYYVIEESRKALVVLKFLGESFQGILISDFWKVYDKLKALAKQRCLFHLFTELIKVEARNSSAEWQLFQARLTHLLKDAVAVWEKKTALRPELFQRKKDNLYFRLDWLIGIEYSDKDCKRLRKRLEKYRGELFTFLKYDEVSPYNNHAEQQMRKPVLWRRRCQQNRSDKGAEAQAILMTVFRTAELQGLNPVDYVETLVKEQILKHHSAARKQKNAA